MKVFKTHEWEYERGLSWPNLKVDVFTCKHCGVEKRKSQGKHVFYFRPTGMSPERKPVKCNHRELWQHDL